MDARKGLLLGCMAALAAVGCSDRDLRPLNPCTVSGVSRSVRVTNLENVDLLFMVDNSNSMASEQALLRQQFPRMVQGLVTGDPDLNPSTTNFTPVKSLRVAVVDSDMGVNGMGENAGEPGLPTCGYLTSTTVDVPRARYGDDGLFNRQARSTFTYVNASNMTVTETAKDPTDPTGNTDLNCDFDGMGGDDLLTFAALPAFLTFDNPSGGTPNTNDMNAYIRKVACMTNLGTGGCGFEQQLESVLKAITPSTTTPTDGPFYQASGDTGHDVGHGTDPSTNGPWFRSDSLLAIVMVSDEEDCSAKDRTVFNYNAAAPYDDPYANAANRRGLQANTRCNRFSGEDPSRPPSLLHDVQRYIDGIVAMRQDPGTIVFAAITGIPYDLTDELFDQDKLEGIANLQTILDDPRMRYDFLPKTFAEGTPQQVTIDEAALRYGCAFPRTLDVNGALVADTTRTVPNDVTALTTYTNDLTSHPYDTAATPGRRFVRVAQGLQAKNVNVLVQSICAPTFDNSVTGILTLISAALGGRCLPRDLNRNSANVVNCNVLEELPAGMTCADVASKGRDATAVRQTADGRDVCRIQQIPVDTATVGTGQAPAGLGWFYDDYTATVTAVCQPSTPQLINFTTGAEPTEGGTLKLECLQPVTGGGLQSADVNTPCTQGGTVCDMNSDQRASFCLRYNLHQSGCEDTSAPNVLFCELDSNTCQIPCTTNADCPGGFVCFDDPNDNQQSTDAGGLFCVNPTCGIQ